jgi:hypothetical protein
VTVKADAVVRLVLLCACQKESKIIAARIIYCMVPGVMSLSKKKIFVRRIVDGDAYHVFFLWITSLQVRPPTT